MDHSFLVLGEPGSELLLAWTSKGICLVRFEERVQKWDIPEASAGVKTQRYLVLAVLGGILGLDLKAFEREQKDETGHYKPVFFLPLAMKRVQYLSCSYNEENLLVMTNSGHVGVSHDFHLPDAELQWLRIFRGFTASQATFTGPTNCVCLLLKTPKVQAVAWYCQRGGQWHFSKVWCAADELLLHRLELDPLGRCTWISTSEGPKKIQEPPSSDSLYKRNERS
jgi:hypothetical protein